MALCAEMEKQLAAAEEVNGALLESVVWRGGKGGIATIWNAFIQRSLV